MCCSFEHLGVNLLIQILIGSLSEMVFKWWGCLLIYLCGVFAGSVTTSIVYSQIGLEGASAGISSLLTAYIGFKIMKRREISWPTIDLMIILPFTLIITVIGIWNYAQSNFVIHLAGGVAGILVGIVLVWKLNIQNHELKYLNIEVS